MLAAREPERDAPASGRRAGAGAARIRRTSRAATSRRSGFKAAKARRRNGANWVSQRTAGAGGDRARPDVDHGHGGPTLIAVDGIEAILSEAKRRRRDRRGAPGRRVLQTLAGGLMELHDVKQPRGDAGLLSGGDLGEPQSGYVASAADRFRESPALPRSSSAGVVERLIASRLAPAYAERRFRAALPGLPLYARGDRKRRRPESARDPAALPGASGRLRREGEIRECDIARERCAARRAPPLAERSAGRSTRFSRAPARSQHAIAFDDEAAVAARLVASCELYLRHFRLPELDRRRGRSRFPVAPNPALHARLRFVLPRRTADRPALAFGDRPRRAPRVPVAAQGGDDRCGARARDSAGGLSSCSGAPTWRPETASSSRLFSDAGGMFPGARGGGFRRLRRLAPARTLAAASTHGCGGASLCLNTKLFQAAGLAPPAFLDAARSAPAPAPPANACAAIAHLARRLARRPSRDRRARRRMSPPLRRSPHASRRRAARSSSAARLSVGELVGPVTLPAALLPRHIAVFADSGAGKSVLLSRIVEEAAMLGAPALVLDVNNDLARLGEPWPSRPTEFTDDDARKASCLLRARRGRRLDAGRQRRPADLDQSVAGFRALWDGATIRTAWKSASARSRWRSPRSNPTCPTAARRRSNCAARSPMCCAPSLAPAAARSTISLRLLLDLPTTASRIADGADARARDRR